MAQLMEYAEYLSKEIGPRPAGTEEEQQAALYITERFQKDAGFSAQIEEFTSSSNIEGISALPGLVVIVVAILAMIFPVLAIPAFILAAASAALYALEAFGHPLVTRALARGASQNVVAKYQPGTEEKTARGRSRKVVLVARYDSEKVTPSLVRTIESAKLPVPIGLICVCGIVLAAFFLLLHIFINFGIGGLVVNVLTVICLIVCAYPVLRAVLFRTAPYNEGANNNASGAAALLEVARRISRGSVSEADLAGDPSAYGVSIHGEQAARESGLVPEGAQILYEAEQLVPPSEIGEYDPEESLLAAKAAIAAMTGKPVERRVFGSVATQLVNSRAQGEDPAIGVGADRAAEAPEVSSAQPVEAQAAPAVAAQPIAFDQPVQAAPVEAARVEEPPADGDFKNAPSWFVSARQNAKKPAGDTGPVQRSRYTEAIEAAEREAAARELEAAERAREQREAELKERLQREAEQAERDLAARTAEDRETPEPQEAAEPQGAQVAEEPVFQQEDIPAPVFVPYAEAMAQSGPVNDDFAASLGETTAFDPRMVQEGLPVAEEGKPASRLADLPPVSVEEPAPAVQENTSPSRSGMFRKLRADVPSMSGVIRMQRAGEDVSQLPKPQEEAVAPLPMQRPVVVGTVGPEPLDDYDDELPLPADEGEYDEFEGEDGVYYEDDYEEEQYGEPYDDGYDEPYDDPAPVEMPKSRAGGFFSRFRRNKQEDLAETPQEWLDVDDDFDARTVGRERGGWESFREDYPEDRQDGARGERRWEGGAFSRVRLGRVNTLSGEDTDADLPAEPIEVEEDRQIAEEIEQIYHFRNPLYNTEIWFVALGSEGRAHDGAKAFLAEHADDLRGAMVIEVESLGAGELCTASAEGSVKQIAASSRVKRYTRAASTATGIVPGTVDLTGADSAASIIQSAGYQAMHLLGVEDGRPALKGSPDDILENIDDLLLDDNVNFLMELLKK